MTALKPGVKNLIFAGVAIAGVYGLVYWDVVSRAKESYLQGEKYMRWHADPTEKKRALDAEFEKEKGELDRRKDLPEDEYKKKIQALEFDREFALGESSLKYAYQWYKDAYELFSPPESKWVRMARQKAPEALAMWKQELRDKKIPFEETMFE